MIIDAFPFFQEVDLLKVRLEFLGKHVDRFIISESSVDFSGKPKKLLLGPEQLVDLPYSDKIHVVRSSASFFQQKILYPMSKRLKWRYPLWQIQSKQRNVIFKKVSELDTEGTFFFGDLDEFPAPIKILRCDAKAINNSSFLIALKQSSRVYNLKTQDSEVGWRGTMVCSLKVAKKTLPNTLRKMRFSSNALSCGWHFSYFGGEKQVRNKIESISAVEKHFNLDAKSEFISKRINSKVNPFSSFGATAVNVPLSEYPTDLLECFQMHMPSALG